MEKSEKYAIKMQTQLKEWDTAVDRLADASKKYSGEALVAYQETLRKMRAERDSAHDTFKRMRVASAEAGRQLQSQMRVAWHTMESALADASVDKRK
jgi:hypothetical protein